MGTRGPVPTKRTSTDWTPELAYIVGLIATDGNLSKDGRHLDFTSKDIQLVKLFRAKLYLHDLKIGTKRSGSGNISFRIQFGDVNFYRWLQKIGLSPRKSLTIAALRIPDRYFFDFLRGCFDGDGSINGFWDKRWHSSYMFYMQFASASLSHMVWLQDSISRLAGIHGKIKKGAGSYQLTFAKQGTKVLFKEMFYDREVPHLIRKYKKAIAIFEEDKKS